MCLKAVSFLTRICGYSMCYTRCSVQANTGETPVVLCIGNAHFLVVRDRFAQRVCELRLRRNGRLPDSIELRLLNSFVLL